MVATHTITCSLGNKDKLKRGPEWLESNSLSAFWNCNCQITVAICRKRCVYIVFLLFSFFLKKKKNSLLDSIRGLIRKRCHSGVVV